MAIRYTSNNISNISNSVFFDANILIYLFWPSPSRNNLSEKYARIFAALLKKNISLYTNTFVISEVINRILRIEWDNQTSKKINFKDFRNSECGKTVQKDVFDIIKKLAESGKGIVMVLHDIATALQFSDSVLVMNGGKNVFFGSPDEVVETGVIKDVFGVGITKHDGAYFYERNTKNG